MTSAADPPVARAVVTATTVARSLGLDVRSSTVLNASTATTVRLLPCDVVARVAPSHQGGAELQLELALQLARLGAPVVPPDPRVPPVAHHHDGSTTTFWSHCESSGAPPVGTDQHVAALVELHRGLRHVTADVPHLTDRLRQASALLLRTDLTPGLVPTGRDLLVEVLTTTGARVGAAPRQQVLHGEPHAGNLLAAPGGPLFVDWETCCRGPVEFDLAHAPAEVGRAYPGADPDLLQACRLLSLAVATTWRYDVADRLPGGPALGEAWLAELRASRRDG